MIPLAVAIFSTIITLPTSTSVLAAARSASGGSAWATTVGLVSEGSKVRFGLRGSYRESDDVKTGYFLRTADFASFENVEGCNESGRWRTDLSGVVHVLNSREAKAVALTERYIVRRAYFDERAVRSRFAPGSHGGPFYRVEVAPQGGRAATLWFRKSTLLLERVTIQRSEREEVVRFADYRKVGALRLPFAIAVDDGDELESGRISIVTYRLRARSASATLRRPPDKNDVTFASADETSLPVRVDAGTGFLIVWATVDGRGPLPFILDTGGHDILTPATVDALALPSFGSGESFGAGSGSTATRYTTVHSLRLGAATLSHQPFTVLYLDLGHTRDERGRDVPIAGILGLEIFERFVVTLNERSERLTLASPRTSSRTESIEGEKVALFFTSDMPLIRASLDGMQGDFSVDTGNNAGCILFAQWLRTSALEHRVRYGKANGGQSVGGAVDMRDAEADTFQIGRSVFHDVPIVVTDTRAGSLSARSEAGNIGLSLLARFERITFDYSRGTMFLERGR